VSFTGLEGEFLLIHGVRVEMREGVGGAAESWVHGAIHFVEARGHRLSLLRHRRALRSWWWCVLFGAVCWERKQKKGREWDTIWYMNERETEKREEKIRCRRHRLYKWRTRGASAVFLITLQQLHRQKIGTFGFDSFKSEYIALVKRETWF